MGDCLEREREGKGRREREGKRNPERMLLSEDSLSRAGSSPVQSHQTGRELQLLSRKKGKRGQRGLRSRALSVM